VKSGPSYLDVNESARWIQAQLQKQGLTVSEALVLRILHLESRFMTMVNLTEPPRKDGIQSGHLYRQACWVLDPSAQVEGDQEIEPEGRRRDEP